jgi:hypothetical protein
MVEKYISNLQILERSALDRSAILTFKTVCCLNQCFSTGVVPMFVLSDVFFFVGQIRNFG